MRGNRSVCVCVCVCVRVTVSIYCLCVFQCFCEDVHICVCVFVCFMLSCVLTGFCVWAVCVCLCLCVCYVFCCVYSCVFSVLFCCCRRKRLPTPTAVLVGTLGATWTRTHTFKKQQTTKTNKPPYMPIKKTQGQRERVGEREACLRQKNWIIFESLWAIKEKRQSSGWNPPTLKVYLKMTNKQTLRLVDFSLRVKSKQPACGSVWFLFFRVLWLCFLFLMQQNTRW